MAVEGRQLSVERPGRCQPGRARVQQHPRSIGQLEQRRSARPEREGRDARRPGLGRAPEGRPTPERHSRAGRQRRPGQWRAQILRQPGRPGFDRLACDPRGGRQHCIVRGHSRQAGHVDRERGQRQSRKQIGEPDGIARERPGQPRQGLAQRQPDRAREQCDPAQHHHGWLRGQDQGVGRERGQRQILKVEQDQRQGRDLGRERAEHALAADLGHALGPGLGHDAREQRHAALLKGVGVEDEAERRAGAELISDVPHHTRIPGRHEQAGDRQRAHPVGAPAQSFGGQPDHGHECRAHDGGAAPDQPRIQA